MGSKTLRDMFARTTLLFVVLIVLPRSAHAQASLPPDREGTSPHRSVFGIGIAVGPVSGIGLSFRHHFPGRFSYQITGGIIKVDEQLHYAVGLELQWDLIRKETDRIFIVAAGGYYHSGKSGENSLEGPGRLGLGVGGELYLGGGFHGTGEILFSYFSDGNVLPLPQVGFHYYFY
jgi:hypothetical protein